MAELTQVEPRRVSVVADGRRRDVVVDGRARVGDVLDELGLPPGTEALLPDGSRVARTAVLVGVADGVVLLAVDGAQVAPSHLRAGGAFSAAHAPGSRAGHDDDGDLSPAAPAGDPAAGLPPGLRSRMLAAAVLALLALAGTVAVLARPGGGVASGGVLLVGALLLAWAATGPWTLVVAVVGGGVGAGLVELGAGQLPAGSAHLTVAAAGIGAAVVAVLGRAEDVVAVRCRRTMIATGLLTAGAALLALGAGLPVAVLAAGALGVAVLLARVLPDLVVRLDDSATVDLDRLSTTAWSPRPRGRRPRRWRLRRDDLAEQVTAATTHQRVVLAGLLAVVVLAAGALVVAGPGTRTATAVLLATAGGGLTLVARRYHGSADRWLLRLSGLASLAGGGVVAVEGLGGAGALAVVGAAVVVGVALVLLAPLAGRGWTSLALSRVADLLEALCVAAALPLVVWAAGLVSWIRSLVG